MKKHFYVKNAWNFYQNMKQRFKNIYVKNIMGDFRVFVWICVFNINLKTPIG